MRLERTREVLARGCNEQAHYVQETQEALAEIERAEAVLTAARKADSAYANLSDGNVLVDDAAAMRELWRRAESSHNLLASALAAFGSGEGTR